MNRGKRSLTIAAQKKMNKEVHRAQAAYPVKKNPESSDQLTTKEMLKKYPKRVAKKLQEQLLSMEKSLANKHRSKRKVSKRTAPGTVTAQPGSPAYPHKEGGRWIKTLTQQTQANKKVLLRHLAKHK